jgi:hypothetical protein
LDKNASAVVTSGNPFATLPPCAARPGMPRGPERRDSAHAQTEQARLRLVNQPVARRVLFSARILLVLPIGQGPDSLAGQCNPRRARGVAPPPRPRRGCGNNASYASAGDARRRVLPRHGVLRPRAPAASRGSIRGQFPTAHFPSTIGHWKLDIGHFPDYSRRPSRIIGVRRQFRANRTIYEGSSGGHHVPRPTAPAPLRTEASWEEDSALA